MFAKTSLEWDKSRATNTYKIYLFRSAATVAPESEDLADFFDMCRAI